MLDITGIFQLLQAVFDAMAKRVPWETSLCL